MKQTLEYIDLGVLKKVVFEEVSTFLNDYGNKAVGLIKSKTLRGEDIDGGMFVSIEKSTEVLRAVRGSKSFTPMVDSGEMVNGVKLTKRSTPKKLGIKIESTAKSKKEYNRKSSYPYGYVHLKDTTVPAGANPIDDEGHRWKFQGKHVPARKWFGIHKDLRAGGKEIPPMANKLGNRIKSRLKGKTVRI